MQTPQRGLLKRTAKPMAQPAMTSGHNCETHTALVINEFMNAATSFHKLHLKVTGMGSYAQHKALNELYDAMPDHADDLAEGYQGACECLLTYPETAPLTLNSVEDALMYCNELKEMINGLQSMMPYTEIINDLDTAKSTINSIKYKLLFLK
jgi:DNA-binding ferritin-like protein